MIFVLFFARADTSVGGSTKTEMWQIMWKPNKFSPSATIKWHLQLCEARCQSIGVNLATNIGLHRNSIEVKLIAAVASVLSTLNRFAFLISDEKESQIAFEKHFDAELQLYKSICIINLVEQSGKEKIIFDAYGNHVVKYNNDQLIYVTFDFHDYW